MTVTFSRDFSGKISIRVHGTGKSKAELKGIGEQLSQALTQQYVYHRLRTEMQNRGLNLVDEQVEEDGTVRMQVRTYRS